MTDIEKISLERARKINPHLDLLIKTFDLDINTLTPAEKTSAQVQNRVDQWFSEFAQPAKPMDVYVEPNIPRIFWTPEQMKEWITKTNFSL